MRNTRSEIGEPRCAFRWGGPRANIIPWSFVPLAVILVAVAAVIFCAYQDVAEDVGIDREFLLLLLVLGVVVPVLVVAVGVRRITKSMERRVADRARGLAALNAIAVTVSQSLDLDERLSDALDTTLQVMEIEAGGVYLLDEEAGELIVAAQRGFSPQFVAEIDGLKVGEGLSGRVVQSGQPLVVRNVSTDPRLTRMVVREEGLRSVAIVPLSSRGKVLGTLSAATHGYREFSDQDVRLLTSIGRQIGVAIENARLFEAEQRRAEQFHVISEIGRRISTILPIDELLVQMAELIQEAFHYYHVGIGLIEGDEVVSKAEVGGWGGAYQSLRLKVGQEEVWGWVAQTGEPLLVPDVSKEPRFYFVPPAADIRSQLCVPLKAKEAVIGVLSVESDQLNAFDMSDLAVLQSLANQAAVVIENARLLEAEQRRAEQFRVIGEVGRHIASILDVDELLGEIVRLLKETFGYYLITIGLIEGDEVVFKAGAKTHWDERQFRPPPLKVGEKGITAWVAATGEPLLVPDVRQEPRYRFLPDAAETRSELAVPLKTKSGVIGVLNVESDQLNGFDESDLVVLQSLAHQAAITIENARLYEQAQQLAVVQERQRLARELHDAVTQTLFSASLIAEVVPQVWAIDPQEGHQQLEEVRLLTQGALAEMRTLLLELRPGALIEAQMDDLLRQLGSAMTGRTGVPVAVTTEGAWSLPASVQIALYRIAQEALNNAGKHAEASKVDVCFTCGPGRVTLSISDDGRGFDVGSIPPGHLGVGIMRERATAIGAQLEIESQVGHGAKVVVVWTDDEQSVDG